MKLSIVIPMYNESKIVENSIMTVHEYMEKTFGAGNYEVLYVNDGSTDNCFEIAKNYVEKNGIKGIKITGYEKNQGKGAAVRYGFMQAEGDYIFFTDCDLAYGMELFKPAIERFEESGADILIGSRKIGKNGYEGYTFLRKLMSKTYLIVLNTVTGFRHSDSQCGFKGFKHNAAKDIFSECEINGFAFDLEALIIGESKGYKVVEFPVRIVNHNDSKVHPVRDTLRMLRDVRKIKKRQKQKRKNKGK